MIALYIILGIILFVFLLLNIPVGIDLSVSNNNTIIRVIVLCFKFSVYPTKKKQISIKKEYKRIKKTKLASYTKKSTKKKKENSVLTQLKEIVKDKENIQFLIESLLNLLKEYALKFKKHLHIVIDEILLSLDFKESDKSCIMCGVIYPSIIATVDFLNYNSKLKIIDNNKISVAPAFNNDKTLYSIKIRLSIRLICLITPVIKTVIKFIKKYIFKSLLKERKLTNG